MPKTINNLVNHIEIVHGTSEKETIPKLGLRTIIQGDRIILISPAGGSGTTSVRQSVTFLYTDVVTPSTSSAEELRDIILTWIATGEAGGGGGIPPDYKIGSYGGTVTYASNVTVTLAGNYPAINNDSQILYIKFVDSTLETSERFDNAQNGVTILHSGGTLEIFGAGTPFASTNVYEVGMSYTPIGADIAGDALKTLVQNMEAGHYTDPEHVDEDNAGAQNDTKYTRTAIEMGSYKYLSFTYLITSDDIHNDVRLKVYATNKNDYSLPDEDTAIVDSDIIFDVSEEVLGNAAGISVNNGSSGDNECIDKPTKYYAFIFELKYDEDNTGTPLNAVDVYITRY